ncbi:MAG TPA: phytanoyl-CoA dioxygenase family protein [Candidatus Binataceae bacterium]|nr:phytanoyl-CoA dioxygenase family protein [Candidatus Binataceae bacterium]
MPVTQSFTLTPEQRDAFKRAGILRLDRLLSADGVRHAREAVLRRLEPLELWKAGAWHLDALPRPQWPNTGLKTSQVIGNRHPELAALVEESALGAAVDALLEGRPYERPGPNRRPQVLFTLPNAQTWTVPSGWHSDRPRLASGQSAGVQLFAFLDVVDARSGGTLAIAGSHHLLNEGRHIRPSEFGRLLRAEPFFADLLVADPPVACPQHRADLLHRTGAVGNVQLQIVEMTGVPGDVWLMDLRVLHVGSPNASERPRMMLTFRYERSDLLREVADAFGWR